MVISDWAQLDEFIAKLPDPEDDPDLVRLQQEAERARSEGRYLLWGFWNLFFERPQPC